MKKFIAIFSLTSICFAYTTVYAGDAITTGDVRPSTIRIKPVAPVNNIRMANSFQNNSDIRSQFLFAVDGQPDAFKNMTFRSAIAGAGILGAIMGGKIAAKVWIAPHMCFSPGIDIGAKRADFILTF